MMPTLGGRPDRFNESVLVDEGPAAARLQRRRRVLLIKAAALGQRREAVRVAPSGAIGVRYSKEPSRAGVAVERLDSRESERRPDPLGRAPSPR